MSQNAPKQMSRKLSARRVRLKLVSPQGTDAQARVRSTITGLQGTILNLVAADEPRSGTVMTIEFRPRSILSAGEIISRLTDFCEVSFAD